LMEQLLRALREALSEAISDVFIVGLVAAVVAFALHIFLKELPLRKSHIDD